MENIIYNYGDNVYLNITNVCPCDCDFCIRRNTDGVGDKGSLWLDHEPSYNEIVKAIDEFSWNGKKEAVFCGFGEPTCALSNLLKTAEYLKKTRNINIRLNTNGLSDIINNIDDSAKRMKGLIDTVSISLNASDAKKYAEIVRPPKGEEAFYAMLKFTKECKKYIPFVKMTVVDVIGKEETEKCKELCKLNGIDLRVREYIK